MIGKKIYLCLNDLYDLSGLKSGIGALMNNPNLNKEMKAIELNYQQETAIKTEYQTNYTTKDTSYWSAEIAKLNQKSKTDKTGIYDRLLGYLSLASYSYANQAFSQNNVGELEKILFIYQKSDPTNPEQAFMRAKLFILKKIWRKQKHVYKKLYNLELTRTGLITMRC